jgi:hypothetical protein
MCSGIRFQFGRPYHSARLPSGIIAASNLVLRGRPDEDESARRRVVVYKVDRLTRSLADFAKLVASISAADR